MNNTVETNDPAAPGAAAPDSTKPAVAEEQPALSPEEIDALKAQADLATQHWDRLLRVSADFDNFKKRAAREREDAIKYANQSLLQKVIPVLDNFEMALAATAGAEQPNVQSLQAGVGMIHQQFKSVLAEAGLEEVNAAGQAFDPNFHEAVSQQDTTEVPAGHVLLQLRKGYKLRDRLLRPATVVVARQPAA